MTGEGRNRAKRRARSGAPQCARRLFVEQLEQRELFAGLPSLNEFGPIAVDRMAADQWESSDLANSSFTAGVEGEASAVAATSVVLPYGPDFETAIPCGEMLCLNRPNLVATAMLPDGTLRLISNSPNHNPSPLTVRDVNSRGEIVRQFSLSGATHDDPIRNAGSTLSISPNGQWVAIGDKVFQIDSPEALQTIPWPADIPIGASLGARVSDNGQVLISALGKSYVWDAASGLRRLDSQFVGNPAANSLQLEVAASAISPEGYVVVGNSGGNGDYGHATGWDTNRFYALPDRGHPSSALTVSENGRHIGGSIRDLGAVVWSGDRLRVLVDDQGEPLPGFVSSIVTGFGGESTWVAFGVSEGQVFVAFNDGVAHPLRDWLDERYGIELSDETLMGAFYHEGALSLVTAQNQYATCSPDPIDCASFPPTQLAVHLTVVPVNGAGNEVSGRPVPFTTHLLTESIFGYSPGMAVPTADGFRALGLVGNETVINDYDRTGQITRTIHLAVPPGQTFGVSQFSDDGLWAKGQASTTTESMTVYWNLEHPDQPLRVEQLDASTRPSFSTAGASADGRVKIRQPETSTYTTVAIEVDGVAHEIHDVSGAPITGGVDYLFAGIGGVATRWIAVGQYVVSGYSGPYTDYFIAFSDGSMMKLWDFLHDQWPTTDYIDTHYINVSVGSGSILFVDSTFGGGNCFGSVCTGMINFTGFSVTSIPLPDKWVNSPLDMDRDGHVFASDALAVINYLNDHGSGPSANVLGIHAKYDINDDGFISPQDVLLIINSVNAAENATVPTTDVGFYQAEGEAANDASTDELFAAGADLYFQSFQPRRRSMAS